MHMSESKNRLDHAPRLEPQAANELFPQVFNELRKLAAHKLMREKPGQTLQATALVNEAYLRLIDGHEDSQWSNRGHFFAAAAEAMRRILIERARAKASEKRGGDWHRVDFENLDVVSAVSPENLVSLDEAITRLTALDQTAAELVKLRYYAGLSLDQAAEVLQLSSATVYRHWAYARAWLRDELLKNE